MLIDCHRLPAFVPRDLATVRAAFQDATHIHLRQAWLASLEPAFAPAVVRTGWRGASLLVFAELADHDVFTTAQRHNQRFWELGDTFEMFLQPGPGTPYVELHVAPNNLRLQLRFDAPPSATSSGGDPFSTALIHDDSFESRTWIEPDAREWCVFAEIPAQVVTLQSGVPLAGSSWRFSFSRYDHTRGRQAPVISSTSKHSELAFHRPHEWNTLLFA